MEEIVQEALTKGVEMHQNDQLDLAEKLYAAVMLIEPKNTDANHNTGTIKMAQKQVSDAIPFFKIALEGNPDNGQFWVSYINALVTFGAVSDANNMLTQAKQRGANGKAFDRLEKLIAAHK
jgi:predicted Zn-dependent protease